MNVRSTALLLLLPLEGILLGVAFDAEAVLRRSGGWWDAIGRVAPRVMPIAAAIATSGLILAGPRIRDELRMTSPSPRSARRTLGWLIAHFVALAGFFVLSSSLFGTHPPRERVGMFVVAWGLAAALTAGFWAAALLPPRPARVVLSHTWGLILASVACGLLAWAAGQYTQHWWGPLRRATLVTSAAMLRPFDATAWCDSTDYLIGARRFTVQVNRQCSGYEGIGLACIALGAWFALYRAHFRFPNVLILLPAAVAGVWLANAARIAALVFVGAHGSREIALGGFHSYAGAILFSCVVLGTAWVAYHSPAFSKSSATHRTAGHNPAAPYLLPILAIAAATLVIGMFSRDGDNALLPLRTLAGLAVLLLLRRHAGAVRESFSMIPIAAGVLVCILWVALTRTLDDPSLRPTVIDPAWRGLWLACRLLGTVVVIPIAEELAFRGYLARRLMDADFTAVGYPDLSWPAIVISSLIFGLLHQAILAATVAGVCYALVARYRGRLTDAIIAHGVTNALLAAGAFASQSGG